jgi:hypothetical protein
MRRKLHARLLRSDPDMVAAVAPFVVPLRSVEGPGAPPEPVPMEAPAPNERPNWPRNGYAGGPDARRLEKHERTFISELAAPLNLENMLITRTGKFLSSLSTVDVEQAATAFMEAMRRDVEQHLDFFTRAEAAWRPPDDSASAMRLARLRWEIDDYLKRLGTETAVLTLAAQDRERASLKRAMAVSETIVNGRDAAAERRALRPRSQQKPRLTIDPRFK